MLKRTLLYVMFPLFLWPMASCQADPVVNEKDKQQVVVDSTVYANLGKTVYDVLMNPSKVTCYRLRGVSNADTDVFQVEPHWIRDTMLGTLTPQMYGVLQFVLIDNPANYCDDSVKVRAPYVPMLEFEFVKKKAKVHVLVSTTDYTWTVMYDDKRQLHFNYVDKDLINRFCKEFLNKTDKKERGTKK